MQVRGNSDGNYNGVIKDANDNNLTKDDDKKSI